MSSTRFTNHGMALAAAILAATILAGCQQQTKFSLEQVPQEYRSCAAEVEPKLKKGPITQKELVIAYAKLKAYAGRMKTCATGLLEWIDAQHSVYYRQF